jgi:hypothetical protein
MKRITTYALTLFIGLSLTFYGCDKTSEPIAENNSTQSFDYSSIINADETIINLIQNTYNQKYKQELKNGRADANIATTDFPDPKWSETVILNQSNGEKIAVTPIAALLEKDNVTLIERHLINRVNGNNKIIDSKFVIIRGNKDIIQVQKYEIMSNNDFKNINGFDGVLVFHDFEDKLINGRKFTNGKAEKSQKDIIGKRKDQNARLMDLPAPCTCTDWYYIVYNENTGQVYSSTYLGSSCGGEDCDMGRDGGAGSTCKPCLPVGVNGLAYEFHSTALGNKEHAGMADHTHHFKMQQSPYTGGASGCKCFWKRDYIPPTNGFSPQPGAILVKPATGGGF